MKQWGKMVLQRRVTQFGMQESCRRFLIVLKKIVVLTLVTVMIFSDLGSLVHLPLMPRVEKAEAATGDIAIYRENTGTETIDSNGTPFDVTWDTTVQSNSNITLQGNNSDIDLADGGKYLVMYNVFAEQGTSTVGTNRRSLATWLTLEGQPLAYGRAGGYIRDSDGDLDAYPASTAILDVTAGDDLQVHIRRDDTNPTAGTNVKPVTNGVSILKLKDSWDYLRLRKTATSSNINGNTSFTDITWDTADETDTGSFGFTPTSGNITLKGDSGTLFLITTNVGLDRTANNTRENYEMILTLDGTELPATRVTTYPRGNNNTNGILSGTLVYSGIIAKTSSSDQTLNVEVRRESSASGGTTVISGYKTAFSAMKVPDTAEVVMVGDTTTQVNSSARTAFTWDTNYRVDTTAFSHTTGSSQINIDKAGDYLFFSTVFATTSVDNRAPYRADWLKNGSLVNYGSHGAYNRANQSFSSGSSGGLILSNLTTSDFVELTHIDETSNTTDTATFQPNKMSIQGIALNENFFGTDVAVSESGSHVVNTDIPSTNVYSGGAFVIQEQSTGRNITDITITESGTVHGANGLDNIKLYYDLDTTGADGYDCSSESYDGGEPQFGSTDTSGFSGADGVSSFTGSVAISSTQSMCVYVVYDVTEAASDGETVVISIDNPSTDVDGSGSPTVGPQIAVLPSGSTTLQNAELTQTHYHWRNDDGDESDTVANSYPVVKATNSNGFGSNSPGNDPVLTVPATAVEGDYMVAIITTDDNNPAQTITPPATETWTLQESGLMPIDGTGAASPAAIWIYTKFVSADDEANAGSKTYTWQDSVGTEEQAGLLILLSDVQEWGEFATNLLTGNRTNVDAPSIDTTEANEIVFHAAFKDTGAAFTGLPSGTSTINSAWGPTNAAGAALAVVYDVYPSITTTGVKNFTHANTPSNGFTFSLRPTNAGGATSIEGAEDAPAIGFANGTTRRLRFGISAEGSTSSLPVQLRLEYATKTAACNVLSEWVDVGVSDGGDWDVVDSSFVTNGDNSTNISSAAYGALTDENTTFLTPNGGVRDTSSQTGSLTFGTTNFTEVEFAIEPTSGAVQGNTYCFRLTDAGTPLRNYDIYAEGTISADINVAATGTQAVSVDYATANNELGGGFVIERPGTSRTVTDITITETGTIDAQTGLTNIELWYDLDTSAPFDCTGESFNGGETQFGSTDTDGFSGPNGTSQFSSAGVNIDDATTMCLYVIYDTTASSSDGETIDIQINNPSSDVVVTSSSVGPSTAVGPTGSTTINGPILTQTHYHWRNDDGDESDTGATSASSGSEDTPISDVPKNSTRRLRVQVSNEGTVSSQATQYVLEYSTKGASCESASTWINVGEPGGAFDMSLSSGISDGNTTDIDDFARGAMTEENTTFVGTGALRETEATTSAITLSSTQYTELEFSIEATADSGYDTTYCFRVAADTATPEYTNYPELTTREKQDFYIQRGTSVISGTSLTLSAGADYIEPSATSAAFVRITNTQITGAGDDVGTNGQQADDVTAYISDQSDITTSFTLSRVGSTANTRVDWEIIEYVGLAGADNEMIVRDVGEVSFAATEFTNSGNTISNVADENDVVVFITGQQNSDAGTTNYNDGLFTASWNQSASSSEFERSDADVSAAVSYAVVEFTGANWQVQRIEHRYTGAGVTETEEMNPVAAVSQAFIHAQKRVGENYFSIDNGGHQVWLPSIGYVSFELNSGAEVVEDQYSVAWVIENTQTGDGAMRSYQSSAFLDQPGAAEPLSTMTPIGGTVKTSNASIFGTSYAAGSGNTYPRLQAALTIASSTHYEHWQSDTNNDQWYRVEVVEWPVAQPAIRQNYYRFYVDNDALEPTDPWPVGGIDLGENTSITALDDPVAEGEVVRIRMTGTVSNASIPELTESYKLQFGKRDTTCSAISELSWTDVGAPGSGEIWRGHDGTPIDGTTLSSSLISPLSNILGTYEEANNSALNPSAIDIGESIEYDWVVEHNGAVQRTDYCFRMVKSDDALIAGYNTYPTLRTTGYTPVTATWRWYDDATSTTPGSPLAAENTAPIDIANQNEIKLRIGVHEIENAAGANVKFKLQYSQNPDFTSGVHDVVSSSTCASMATTSAQIWCYADGGGADGTVIDESVLSDSDTCTGGVGIGCGHYNSGTTTPSTLTQTALSKMEFEFTIKQDGARASAVYYFRLYDIANDDVLLASSTYPSLQVEGAQLSLTVEGVTSGTNSEGVVADVSTTPTSIPFGMVPFDTQYEAIYRVNVDTSATEGYQLFMYATQPMLNTYGEQIPDVTATNDSPSGWSSVCSGSAVGCFGYHTGDDVLSGVSPTRFAANDTYAAVSTTTPDEIMHSSVPTDDTVDVVFKLQVTELQPAGDYESEIVYLAVPVF